MVAQSWGLRRQNKFLESREGDFAQAQANGTLSRDFWPQLTGDFFAIWPNQQVEEAGWEEEAKEDSHKAAEKEGKDTNTSKDKASKSKSRNKQKKERVAPVFASHADWEKDRIKVCMFFWVVAIVIQDAPFFAEAPLVVL
jgi:hypothetical protein